MRSIAIAFLWAAIALAGPSPASAQEGVQDVLRQQLDAAVALMAAEGYEAYSDFTYGRLGRGEQEAFTIELAGGGSYVIVGACDIDCADLDLRLVTVAGLEVDRDLEPDDVPIVTVEVAEGSTFQVNVVMADCDTSWCGYGVGVFARSSGAQE